MNWSAVFFTLLVVFGFAVGDPVCNNYAKFEKKFHCGAKGYFLGYGERYCRRFFSMVNEFDQTGKAFVACTGSCLVDKMNAYLKSNPKTNCSQIENDAYSQHVGCYIQCGFCKACKTNRKALMDVYSLKDFGSFGAMRTVEQVLNKCGGFFSAGFSCASGGFKVKDLWPW
ncbi:hypothetical protein M3Y99_00441800 [Aphelenchoides fujianensis]|nr:hypothetical protein M3Y99_00441800 [Aphelenchoides fujianensis]